MQLVSCPNSSEINRNHQNDVLTVATGIVDSISVRYYCDNSSKGIACIGNVHCYCAFAGLVAPRSPKLGLSYLKIETRGTVLNLVTRPRAHMQSDRGGLWRQCTHPVSDHEGGWEGSARVRAVLI
jgi:hypothetical protein